MTRPYTRWIEDSPDTLDAGTWMLDPRTRVLRWVADPDAPAPVVTEEDITEGLKACRECGCPTLLKSVWSNLAADHRRNTYKAAGVRRREGQGLCTACYRRKVDRAGGSGRDDLWPRELLAGEYEHLRTEGHSKRDIAKRLGVSYATLCKALERTRREVAA